MGQVDDLVRNNTQAFFWGLVVAVVLLVVMYLRKNNTREGIGAGGLQDFDQGYFGASGHEGYAARRLNLEGMNNGNHGGNGTLSGALAAENAAALRGQLGCGSANQYAGMGSNYLDRSNSGDGWVARNSSGQARSQEGMVVDDKLSQLL